MTCCAAMTPEMIEDAAERARAEEMNLASGAPREGVRLLRLAVPDLRCGGCIATLEKTFGDADGVLQARANLTAKTLTVEWREDALTPGQIAKLAEDAGFRVFPVDHGAADAAEKAANRDLLMRMAVAGFAAANIMLLSVSVWSGAEGATRELMHWVSAIIALPVVVYSGRPFFVSALSSLKRWRLNMDAPISLAILLAAGVSLYEAANGGDELYFDAAVSLIFLLLIGRWLDGVMRAGARSAARSLAKLAPRGAWVEQPDGGRDYRPLEAIQPGQVLFAAPGDRIAVDASVLSGSGAVDRSLLTGESKPARVHPGDRVEAGVLNLDAPLRLRAEATAENSTIAEIAKLVAAAEERKLGLARLADIAARWYAPIVHVVAAATLVGWLLAGLPLREAIMIATAVLIVTCPCALGLAAPMAQAVASGVLFRKGVMLKDGAALERLAIVQAAAFDKTGVLTLGRLSITDAPDDPELISAAAALAGASRHPMSQAIAAWTQARDVAPACLADVRETAGAGVAGRVGERTARLGSASFCGVSAVDNARAAGDASTVWAVVDGRAPQAFLLTDAPRAGAEATLAQLHREGVHLEVLSGDATPAVAAMGRRLDPQAHALWRGGLRPEEKIAAVERLRSDIGPTLMVGDGLNDAPALAAADVSMAPASASDVGRAAADLVFTGDKLTAVASARRVARRTRAAVLQNFGLAAGYNLIAGPIAIAGLAGPLEAAIAMSTSSLLVTANALRIRWMERGEDAPSAAELAPCPRAGADEGWRGRVSRALG